MSSLNIPPKEVASKGMGLDFSKKQLTPQQMESLFAGVSQFFAVLSEPSRLRILYALCQGEKSVSEVIDACGSSQANVSRHLATLHEVGILSRKKIGTTVFYAIHDEASLELCQSVCARVANELFPHKP